MIFVAWLSDNSFQHRYIEFTTLLPYLCCLQQTQIFAIIPKSVKESSNQKRCLGISVILLFVALIMIGIVCHI